MAIYTCGKCAFTFQRSGPVEACPNCGNGYIRAASTDETEEYHKKLTEAKREGRQANHLPSDTDNKG